MYKWRWVQLVARLTRYWWIPVSREFEHHHRLPLFHWARNITKNTKKEQKKKRYKETNTKKKI